MRTIHLCRVCIHVIEDVRYSPEETSPRGYTRKAFNYITCTNPYCGMIDQTLSDCTYADVDLQAYGCEEHPDYAALQARYDSVEAVC